MKARKLTALALSGALALSLAACGGGNPQTPSGDTGDQPQQDGKTYELSLSMHDGATTLKYQYMDEWAKAVSAASDGALNITIYPGGALASQDTVVEAMETGACDIAMVYTTSYDSIFGLTNGVGLPMLGISSAQDATKVLWDLYDTVPEMAAEYNDYVLVHLYSNGPAYMMFGSKAVDSYDAIQGLKIRTSGGAMTDFLTECGAVPMSISASEVYESLEKSLIDGNIGTGSQVKSWNLGEVDHYFMDMPLYCGVWLTLMNKDTFESLPAQVQEAITAYSGEDYSLTLAEYLQNESSDAYAAAEADNGSQWVAVADSERQKFYDAAMNYNHEWIAAHSADGFDAQGYYDAILPAIDALN